MERDWIGQKPYSFFHSFVHPDSVMCACSIPHPERRWGPVLGEDTLENRQMQPEVVSTRDQWSSEFGSRIRLGEERMVWKYELIRS